jgi:hypothetical protein
MLFCTAEGVEAMENVGVAGGWPELEWDAWKDTARALHMGTQIVGKTRLALTPLQNHWWNVPLYVSARGLTTSPMPWRGDVLEIEFCFRRHELELRMGSGARAQVELRPRPVADFYAEYRKALAGLGVEVKIWPMPVEVSAPIRFDLDTSTSVRSRRGGAVSPGADAGGYAAEAVCDGLPGEDQPGAFLLGELRYGGDAVQRAAVRGAAASGPDAAGGVLARGDLGGVVAGKRRVWRGGVLLRTRCRCRRVWQRRR